MSDTEVSGVQGQSPQALRADENEGLLSAIVNQTTVGVAVVDLEGRFKSVNECYCRIVDCPREELLRLGFADITHADDLPQNYVLDQDRTLMFKHFERRYSYRLPVFPAVEESAY